jgi:hypothetical protein
MVIDIMDVVAKEKHSYPYHESNFHGARLCQVVYHLSCCFMHKWAELQKNRIKILAKVGKKIHKQYPPTQKLYQRKYNKVFLNKLTE